MLGIAHPARHVTCVASATSAPFPVDRNGLTSVRRQAQTVRHFRRYALRTYRTALGYFYSYGTRTTRSLMGHRSVPFRSAPARRKQPRDETRRDETVTRRDETVTSPTDDARHPEARGAGRDMGGTLYEALANNAIMEDLVLASGEMNERDGGIGLMMETRSLCDANGTPLVAAAAAAAATYDNKTKQSSSLRLLNDRTIEVSPCVYRPWVVTGSAHGPRQRDDEWRRSARAVRGARAALLRGRTETRADAASPAASSGGPSCRGAQRSAVGPIERVRDGHRQQPAL
jgi:hypothetical protein